METNEQLFRRIIEEGWSKGDTAIIDELASPDFVEHQYGFVPPDASSVKGRIASLHSAFPDFSMTIEDLVSSGDKVWGRMTARGTQKGQFGTNTSDRQTGRNYGHRYYAIQGWKAHRALGSC